MQHRPAEAQELFEGVKNRMLAINRKLAINQALPETKDLLPVYLFQFEVTKVRQNPCGKTIPEFCHGLLGILALGTGPSEKRFSGLKYCHASSMADVRNVEKTYKGEQDSQNGDNRLWLSRA